MRKKIIIFMVLLMNSFVFSSIPENIKKDIEKESYSFYTGKESRDNIKKQTRAYENISKELQSEKRITEEEKDIIIDRLKAMYGNNYEKQEARISDEIKEYINLKNLVQINTVMQAQNQENLELKTRNLESQKNLEKIVSNPKIPSELMTRFKSEAERLYPNNFYEQERYIESSIANFKFYKNIK